MHSFSVDITSYFIDRAPLTVMVKRRCRFVLPEEYRTSHVLSLIPFILDASVTISVSKDRDIISKQVGRDNLEREERNILFP